MAFPKMSGASSKPAPFKRPGVDLDHTPRKWQTVAAIELTLEDVVPDLGLITDMTMLGGADYIRLTGAGGKQRTFVPNEQVFAFTQGQ